MTRFDVPKQSAPNSRFCRDRLVVVLDLLDLENRHRDWSNKKKSRTCPRALGCCGTPLLQENFPPLRLQQPLSPLLSLLTRKRIKFQELVNWFFSPQLVYRAYRLPHDIKTGHHHGTSPPWHRCTSVRTTKLVLGIALDRPLAHILSAISIPLEISPTEWDALAPV